MSSNACQAVSFYFHHPGDGLITILFYNDPRIPVHPHSYPIWLDNILLDTPAGSRPRGRRSLAAKEYER